MIVYFHFANLTFVMMFFCLVNWSIFTSFLSFRKMVSRLEQITILAIQMTIWKVNLSQPLLILLLLLQLYNKKHPEKHSEKHPEKHLEKYPEKRPEKHKKNIKKTSRKIG
jgi:hypothetical protein